MKNGKYSPKKLIEEILKLNDPVQFIGICKILGINIYKEKINEEESDEGGRAIEPKEFHELWSEICDIIEEMNRTRRRNLGRLIYSATKGKDEEGED